jgi:hypothetical protein
VILDAEVALFGDLGLALLDHRVAELHDLAALDADQMVVVVAAVELEDRLAGLEMAPADQTRAFELGQTR